MRKFSLFILTGLFLGLLGSNAQSLTINNVQDMVRQSNYNENAIDANGKLINLSNIDGSPYWHKEFVSGKIIVDGKDGPKTLNVFMRYRIFDDIFEVKKTKHQPDSEIMNLKRSSDLGIQLASKKFVFLKHLPIEIRGVRNGYAMVMVPSQKDSGKAALYKRMSQEYRPPQKPKSSYDTGRKARLDNETDYFVKIDGKLYHIKAHKRRAAKGFPDHHKALKKYISKNRIKFRGDRKDSDMIRLVHYYNTL